MASHHSTAASCPQPFRRARDSKTQFLSSSHDAQRQMRMLCGRIIEPDLVTSLRATRAVIKLFIKALAIAAMDARPFAASPSRRQEASPGARLPSAWFFVNVHDREDPPRIWPSLAREYTPSSPERSLHGIGVRNGPRPKSRKLRSPHARHVS